MRDFAIASESSWLVAFDNLSGVQRWLSDALCRLATGGGFATLGRANREQTGWFAAGLAATILAVVVIGWMANRALRKVEEASGATPEER